VCLLTQVAKRINTIYFLRNIGGQVAVEVLDAL
jgi:hypothetical protein